MQATHVEHWTTTIALYGSNVAAHGSIERRHKGWQLAVHFFAHVRVRSRQMLESTAGEGTCRAVAAASPRRSTLTGNATESLSIECIQRFRASEAGLIADPESTVLLPGEVWQEIIFRVDVVTERTRAEEGIYEATVRELT